MNFCECFFLVPFTLLTFLFHFIWFQFFCVSVVLFVKIFYWFVLYFIWMLTNTIISCGRVDSRWGNTYKRWEPVSRCCCCCLTLLNIATYCLLWLVDCRAVHAYTPSTNALLLMPHSDKLHTPFPDPKLTRQWAVSRRQPQDRPFSA